MPDIFISQPEEKKNVEVLQEPKTEKVSEGGKSVEGLPGHNHNPLSSFCYYPHRINFINKESDEEVILLVRRHFITNIPWILLVVGLAIAPKILTSFPLISFLPNRFQFIFILFWYLLDIAIFFQGFLSWFFSVNIITNKRVIDVDFLNLIYREITDAKLSHIEDATVQIGSVIRTIFDYGDVVIQTAAEIPQVEFDSVPHPDRISKILSDLRVKGKSSL